ncbi:MAG: hypothetical protein JWQ77_1013, partial [Jatrophihabitans sp.]|nr:hypothetical protein [Jatrophihabitans sp.]
AWVVTGNEQTLAELSHTALEQLRSTVNQLG